MTLVLLGRELRIEMKDVLNNQFGFQEFRHCQKAVVISSLLGNDCCVLMPTGKRFKSNLIMHFRCR